MAKLLVVDDDKGIQKQLKWGLSDYEIIFADDRQSAITQLRRFEPEVVTLDLGLPPDAANASEGIAALTEILSLAPKTKVIVLTGNTDKENALKSVELGAYDFYQKPVDVDTLNTIIARAFNLVELEQENRRLSKTDAAMGTIIGNSDSILAAAKRAEKIAKTEITTLLLGESGTGKEVFARAIHNSSDRANKAFVAINCASIPENLLESELFGYEKGAFTGANKTTKGKIETAQSGTLFLDEIGDMPIALQAKMLRFLQERVIERVGGREEIPVDIRVICATHRNLQDMSAQETFREDLFYRISELIINIPPLRDRGNDVLLLAKSFLDSYNDQFNKSIRGFSDDAKAALAGHKWPGNIRELQNKLKTAVVMADTPFITADDLGLFVASDTPTPEFTSLNLREVREKAETAAIRHAYNLSEKNISRTAELLGVTRPTLYSLLDKYEMTDIKS
ncbi:PEP-CTERM-box response regulator transcription factor [Catenovulum maritimum]|uniref:Fis family transcriptional regulator n=1 Tax=Catenovulum maritimum TaxID=1513271 RepID=A0A0J8GVB9_9ALTE|nr:PEP-CTERM-box response regulator transcription factor [Catenovulum maritimum]KMT64618.1 Fis family transcriptional regulator [Catenovulum maritimum]